MTQRTFRYYHRSDRHFLVLLGLLWTGFFGLSYCAAAVRFWPSISSAAAASICALLMLKMFGYFDPLRLFPRKSDLIPSAFAMIIAGFGQRLFLQEAFQDYCITYGHILIWVPGISLIVFGGHYSLSRVLLKNGGKRKIVLDLPVAERTNIAHEYFWKGMREYIEFLNINDLKRHLLEGRSHEINLIVICHHNTAQFDADAALIRAHLAGIPILDYRYVATELAGRVQLGNSDLWTYLMEATPQTRLLRMFNLAKNLVEPIVAVVLAVLLSPLFLIVAVLVRLTSPGPIFYRQTRTGYLGKTFQLIKFRSMVVDAEAAGPQWSSRTDARLTPFGAFLRKTRLDELPQLWNVIRGDMNFVGPRPERPEIYARFRDELPLFAMRLIVRPGITGWAQICAGYAASIEESRTKLEYDLYYIQRMSPRLDFVILLKTVLVMFTGGTASEKQPERVSAASVA